MHCHGRIRRQTGYVAPPWRGQAGRPVHSSSKIKAFGKNVLKQESGYIAMVGSAVKQSTLRRRRRISHRAGKAVVSHKKEFHRQARRICPVSIGLLA